MNQLCNVLYFVNFVSKFETNKSYNNYYERDGTKWMLENVIVHHKKTGKQFLASSKQRCTPLIFTFLWVALVATLLVLVKLREVYNLIKMNICVYRDRWSLSFSGECGNWDRESWRRSASWLCILTTDFSSLTNLTLQLCSFWNFSR